MYVLIVSAQVVDDTCVLRMVGEWLAPGSMVSSVGDLVGGLWAWRRLSTFYVHRRVYAPQL